jgi:hypothetical protein
MSALTLVKHHPFEATDLSGDISGHFSDTSMRRRVDALSPGLQRTWPLQHVRDKDGSV